MDVPVHDEPQKALLRDDHPLLDRFQATLKAHLLRVKAKLEEECLEIEQTLQERQSEQEEEGAQLYDAQQQIKYQRRQLESLARETSGCAEERRKLNDEVEDLRKDSEDLENRLQVLSRKYQTNLVTVENLNDLANYTVKWQEEAESALKVAHRITKKDGQDKLAKIEEKRRLDVFVLTLEAEVRNRECDLKEINEQIKRTSAGLEKFSVNLTDANSDCEALQLEQKRLNQAWGEVIVSITQRDKMLAAVNQELHEEYEKHKDLRGHIEGTKKELQKQSVQNEKYEGFLNRLTGDLQSLDRQLAKETREVEKLNDSFNNKQLLYEQTEKDLKRAQLEGVILENQLKGTKHRIELQVKNKVALEEQILNLLQEQISSDKAGQYRARLLRELQEKRRQMEVEIATTENAFSALLLDLERVRGSVVRYQELQENFLKDEAEMKRILDTLDEDTRGTLTQISLRQSSFDALTKQLDNVVEALGGREVSPEENRIAELKQELTQLDRQMEASQTVWLKLQNHLVHLNEKRSRQTNEIYIARKQDLIIDQKKRKIERELLEISAEEEKMLRATTQFNNQIQFLGQQLFSKQLKNSDKEIECNRNFDQFYEKLKESEHQVYKVDEEISELEQSINTLKEGVIEKNREIVSWDGKYKTIVNVKQYQDSEASVEGEINRMKMEIHRMEVRHAQLKRAQEKLIQDLDNCVIHREKIFNQSLVRSKVTVVRSRHSNTEEKVIDLRSRIRQINQDSQLAEKSVQELSERQREIEGQLRRTLYEMESERQKDQAIRAEIEEAHLLRHANLEAIVKGQRRTKRFKAILMNAYAPKFRTEASIENRTHQQSEIQEQLLSFLEVLVNDFPDHKFTLLKILQTLREN